MKFIAIIHEVNDAHIYHGALSGALEIQRDRGKAQTYCDELYACR
jgi:hypothetical protein